MAAKQQRLIACEDFDCADIAAISPLIEAFCQENTINNPNGTLLVDPASYQLLLVEAPPVEADELADALRWKVKDLIQGELAAHIVDGFLLPEDAFRGRQKMAYAMAVNRKEVADITEAIKSANIAVDELVISELALLHQLNEQHAANVTMLINLGVEKSYLSIIANGALYLNRKLETSSSTMQLKSIDGFADDVFVDNFILELQRSRDYFESQMGKGIISHIVMLPFGGDAKAIHDIMSSRLGVSVSELPVDNQIAEHSAVMQSEKIVMSGLLLADRSLSGKS